MRVAVGALLVVCLVAGCSSSASARAKALDPEHTFCIQWSPTAKILPSDQDLQAGLRSLTTMTAGQRLATSRLLIKAAGAKDTSDGFAQKFVGSITVACQADARETIADIAAALSALDTRDFN